jgi:hypothetical protein
MSMMNTKTGLWALSLFAAGSVALVSCGGDSDGGNQNAGGKSPTAGSGTTAGTSSGSGGGSSAAGSDSGGTSNPGGGNNPGGGRPGTDGGEGPDFPGFGGEGNVPACPDEPAGKTCTPGAGTPNVCLSDGQGCLCQGGVWSCIDTGGEGGAGPVPNPGDLMVDCGDNPMAGGDCDGLGLCIGSTSCGCYSGMVVCLPG